MSGHDPIGYAAALLVLATFCMRGMVALRSVAIASNVAFIAYGALADIHPVLALHLVLLPVNVLRLAEALGLSASRLHRPAAGWAADRPACASRVLSWTPRRRHAGPVLRRVANPARTTNFATKGVRK